MYHAVEASRCKHRYVFILFNLIFCLFFKFKGNIKILLRSFQGSHLSFFQFLSRCNVNWFNRSKKRLVLGPVDVKENLILYIFTVKKDIQSFYRCQNGSWHSENSQLKQIIQQNNQNLAHASWSARWNDCDQGIALNSDWERK